MLPIGKIVLPYVVIFNSSFKKKSDFSTYTDSACDLRSIAGH